MKSTLRLVAAWFGLLSGAAAFAGTSDDVPLNFTRLDLADGRKLKNVVVKSYDAKSERLLVIADGKAMTIPIALVPPPFNQRLKAAPASGSSVTLVASPAKAAPAAPRATATAADQYLIERAGPVAQPQPGSSPRARSPSPPRTPARATPLPARQPAPPPVDPLLAPATLSRHQAAAHTRAHRYYQYEYPAGSNSISVTALDLDLTLPKPVPGWTGRYESTGKAYLEFYDSKGRSFQRATSTFEVVTEQKPGEELNVVGFTRKS